MAKKNVDPLIEPGLKYTGKVGILQGPVPLQVQKRPLTRDRVTKPLGAEGTALRPERPQKQTKPPAALRKRT